MLGIIRNFIRKFSPNLFAYSLNRKPKNNSSLFAKVLQKTDPVNTPGSIENKQCDRLGFMEGEGSVHEWLPMKSKTCFLLVSES